MSDIVIREELEIDKLDASIVHKLAALWEAGDKEQRAVVVALAEELFARNQGYQDLLDALAVADVSHPVVAKMWDELVAFYEKWERGQWAG